MRSWTFVSTVLAAGLLLCSRASVAQDVPPEPDFTETPPLTVPVATGLGVVQGITEFLPVSSSGHLALAQWVLDEKELQESVTFDVALHLATLLAVVLMLWRDILFVLRQERRLLWVLAVGTVPIGVLGVLLKQSDAVMAALKQPPAVATALLLLAFILIVGERKAPEGKRTLTDVNWLDGLLIGLAQALAVQPGISRSGSKIMGGLWRRLDRQTAFTFSFALYIPAVLGVTLVEARNIGGQFDGNGAALVAGFGAALLTGMAAVWALRRVVMSKRLAWFGIYCAVVGLLAMIGWFAGV